MAKAPEADSNKASGAAVEAETLQTRSDSEKTEAQRQPKDEKVNRSPVSDSQKKRRLLAFRPSHKATFIGLAVVILILGINAAVLGFLLNKESANSKLIDRRGVTISPATLSKLGVNDAQIGNSNEKLIVDPSAQFNSQITVAGNANIGGQLHLNSTLVASNATLSQIQSGSTSANTLNVSGNTTTSTLSVRNNFAVSGTAQFQNSVTVGQLLSVDTSAAIAQNLSVGGGISTSTIAVNNLVISGPLQIGGHVITAGRTPAISRGGSVIGNNGSVSISGNDIAGVIDVNAGTSPSGPGAVAYVSFSSAYTVEPVIVIGDIGNYAPFYIVNASSSGFDIYTAAALSNTNYQIDYIVEQ